MANPIEITIGAAFAASFAQTVTGAQNRITQLGSAMSRINNAQTGIGQMQNLSASANQLGRAYGATKRRSDQLRASLSALESPTKSQVRELERADAATEKARLALERQREALRSLKVELQSAGINTKNLTAESTRLGTQMEVLRQRSTALAKAQAAQQSNRDRRGQLVGDIMGIAALAAPVIAPAKLAIDFESAMADVKKVTNFDAPGFVLFSKDILDLSERIPLAADGLAQIAAAAGAAGIEGSELIRFTEDAAKMSVAFDISAADAGKAMTGLRTNYNLTQTGVISLGDTFNYISNNMDAQAKDMINFANRVAGVANIFKMSGDQVAALGATFLALKIPAEVAARATNTLTQKLGLADTLGKDAQQAFQSLGISASGMADLMKKDGQAGILQFLQAVKKSEDPMRVLEAIFGSGFSDEIANLVNGLQHYEKAMSLATDATAKQGSMENEYAERAKTTANNLELLQNRLKRLGVTIGTLVLPPLNAALDVLGPFIQRITAFAERNKTLILTLITGAGAALGLGLAWKALSLAATLSMEPFLSVNTMLQRLRAQMALTTLAAEGGPVKFGVLGNALRSLLPSIFAVNTALYANPIVWIGAAIAGAAVLIYKYWEPLKAFFSGLFTGISQGFAAFAPVGEVFNAIADAVKGVWEWITQLFEPIKLTSDEFTALSASGQALGEVIGSVLAGAVKIVLLPLEKLISGLKWLKGLVFDDEDSSSQPADASPQPVAARTNTVTHNNQPNISITVPPGTDAQEVADAARREVERAMMDYQDIGLMYDY
jgi:TP901 family phage tail tape measure protein